jgi:S-adenosylmethionine hydrolase
VKHRFISFLTDFGLTDDFVGTCHGVMKRIAPDVQIIDVTHGITPQSVLTGALVVRNTLPYLPAGVHLAVVDPGVGSSRRPVIIRDAAGDLFVGPDNGLLVPAAELRGIESAHELANPAYALEPVSRTFHGRDLFAPAAAHLALGVEPSELGPPLGADALVRLDLPLPVITENELDARVLSIDRFGNMQLNMTREDLDQVGIVPGTRFEVEVAGERYYATAARTYADARPGEIVLYEDSYRNVAIAINRGSAAEMFSAQPGQRVLLHVERP